MVRLAVVAAVAAAMTSMQPFAQAQRSWNVPAGNFNVAGNWTPAGVPVAGETATINNAGTATLNTFQDIGAIEIASGGGTAGTLAMTAGGDLFVSDIVHVGEQGTGTLTINNAKLDAGPGGSGASIFVGGQNSGGTGTMTISGGNAATVDADDDFVVGRVGTGTLNMQGGYVTAGFTVVAKYGTGVWNQSGGVFAQKFGDIEIGDGGNPSQTGNPGPRTGTINLTGGVLQGSGHFAIGNRVGTGTVNVSGGAIAMTGDASGSGTIFVGRGYQWDGQTGAGAATSLRVTGDDAVIIANGGFDMNSSGVASSSTLIAEITGATHTTIKVGGDALIANGKLAVDLTGYVPVVGDSWTILQAGVDILNAPEIAAIDALVSAGSYPALVHNPSAFQGTLQGTFSSIDYSQAVLPAGRGWNISYANNSVVLSVVSTGPAFSADFNNDGKVDGADLTKWKQSFGGAGADANGDGTSNGSDFLMWQQQFGSGVPAVPAVGAVPEPASMALVGLAAAVMALGLRRSRSGAPATF